MNLNYHPKEQIVGKFMGYGRVSCCGLLKMAETSRIPPPRQ